MKNILFIGAVFLISVGCQSDDTLEADNSLVGTWKLVELYNPWFDTIIPVTELNYTEYYDFRSDGTVKKYRSTNESIIGIYELIQQDDGKYIKIIYKNDRSTLITSCFETESLKILQTGLRGGAVECDGPGRIYKKAKKPLDL